MFIPHKNFHAMELETPLGTMFAIAHSSAICLLNFIFFPSQYKAYAPNHKSKQELNPLPWQATAQGFALKNKGTLIFGVNGPLQSLQGELERYFQGALQRFQTPLDPMGTEFQRQVWAALKEIPLGQCVGYGQLAKTLGRPNAFRAVGNANGANPILIAIPCHRVVASNGSLGGYAAGHTRKRWLIEHEKKPL